MGGAITAGQHAGGHSSNVSRASSRKATSKDDGSAEEEEEGITLKDLAVNVRRIIVFVLISWVFYAPFGTRWANNPVTGWDENRTAASWETDEWDWDFIDCFYVRASACLMPASFPPSPQPSPPVRPFLTR
jgi:hypothetical protein